MLLVDIRSQASVKEDGAPALNRVAGKSISLPFTKVRLIVLLLAHGQAVLYNLLQDTFYVCPLVVSVSE